jgi:chaperonin GroES
MAKIKPLGVNILVKPKEKEEVTASGIVLPESESKETPQEGTVVALGESQSINSAIKEGVNIIFKQYAGNKIENDGEEYIIMNAMEDVLAIVE